MAILGWKVARRIKFFWSKSLKTEHAIKSRDLLRFHSNFDITLILIVKKVQKVKLQKSSFLDPPTPSRSSVTSPPVSADVVATASTAAAATAAATTALTVSDVSAPTPAKRTVPSQSPSLLSGATVGMRFSFHLKFSQLPKNSIHEKLMIHSHLTPLSTPPPTPD